jgi:hypothetical protein
MPGNIFNIFNAEFRRGKRRVSQRRGREERKRREEERREVVEGLETIICFTGWGVDGCYCRTL